MAKQRLLRSTVKGIFWSVKPLRNSFCESRFHLAPARPNFDFRTVPEAESCLNASRVYATKPHMAGTEGDLATAKEFLDLLQREFNIPRAETIFPAGSTESRNAILNIARTHAPQAWIDIYYPVMNSPLDRALQALDDDGKVVWEADLEERADDTDPEAGKYSEAVPTFHGLSKDGDVTGKVGCLRTFERYADFRDS